jgi:hemoglobin
MSFRIPATAAIAFASIIVSVLLLLAPGCRMNSLPQPVTSIPGDTTFYGRLGDSAGVAAIMDSLLVQLRADPAIAHYFTAIDTGTFKLQMAQQLCQLAGGPCTYTGQDMATAHHGLNISQSDFNAFISDYLNAMNAAGVADSDQQKVLTLIVSYQSDIVGK